MPARSGGLEPSREAIGVSAGVGVYPTSLGSLKGEAGVLVTIRPGRVALSGEGSLRGDRIWGSEGERYHKSLAPCLALC